MILFSQWENLPIRLRLERQYNAAGVNGKLFWDEILLCYSIELPWKNNEKGISCIPEGEYELRKRYSEKFGWHVEIFNVPQRSFILFHAANDAKKELKGCIAPVSELIGFGVGTGSRKAFNRLRSLVYKQLNVEGMVKLLIM